MLLFFFFLPFHLLLFAVVLVVHECPQFHCMSYELFCRFFQLCQAALLFFSSSPHECPRPINGLIICPTNALFCRFFFFSVLSCSSFAPPPPPPPTDECPRPIKRYYIQYRPSYQSIISSLLSASSGSSGFVRTSRHLNPAHLHV